MRSLSDIVGSTGVGRGGVLDGLAAECLRRAAFQGPSCWGVFLAGPLPGALCMAGGLEKAMGSMRGNGDDR